MIYDDYRVSFGHKTPLGIMTLFTICILASGNLGAKIQVFIDFDAVFRRNLSEEGIFSLFPASGDM